MSAVFHNTGKEVLEAEKKEGRATIRGMLLYIILNE